MIDFLSPNLFPPFWGKRKVIPFVGEDILKS